MLGRNGILNIASFATGKIIPMSNKKLKTDYGDRKECHLGFSKDGFLGLALDLSGTLFGVRISELTEK